MQGYSKGSLCPSVMIRYNGYVEASMQGYFKGSVGPVVTVRYVLSRWVEWAKSRISAK
jgi:hypothetical protein